MFVRHVDEPLPETWPLPGRDEERERFATALADAIQGSPRFVLFEGEQGSGKSSLLDEIARSPLLPRRRIRVAQIGVAPDDEEDFVAHAARIVVRTPVVDRLGLRRFVDMVSRVGGDWLGAIPGWGDLIEAVYRTIEVVQKRRQKPGAGEKLERDIQSILRAARRRPVALLVDNLELANEQTVERLRKLLRAADVGTRLLLVGAFRTPAPGAPRPPIRALIDRVPPQLIVHGRLGPLAGADVETWLSHRLPGAAPAPEFVGWLVAQTGGQPGALEASLGALIESGAIQQTDDSWTIEARKALAAVEASGPEIDLTRLGNDAANTVRAASLFGDRFAGDELARVLERDELLVEDHLALAARYGLVEIVGITDRSNGEIATLYRFSSAGARAALQRAIAPDIRRALEQRLSA
jgi:predicted ATPase